MAIQIRDMDKYYSFTHKMLVDEIYVLKTRLALCKLDNKTMHARYARYASQIKAAAATAKPEPTIKRVVCPSCHGIVIMKHMAVRDVSSGATMRFASCPACQKMFSQKEVNEATNKHALAQASITKGEPISCVTTVNNAPVDIAAVGEKLIGRFGLKNE